MDPARRSGPIDIGLRAARSLGGRATRPRSKWADAVERDPDHSRRYIERFRLLAEAGNDLVGEARLVDAVVPRGAAILDAGCGPGRHAGYLHRAGHRVVGVDLDPVLIEAAEADEPGPDYRVGDLTDVEVPRLASAAEEANVAEGFDAILCAGNVMTFLHPATRRPVLERFAGWLAPEGRALVGFGAGRGYGFREFGADAEASGLAIDGAFSTWDLRPFGEDSSFLMAMLVRAPR